MLARVADARLRAELGRGLALGDVREAVAEREDAGLLRALPRRLDGLRLLGRLLRSLRLDGLVLGHERLGLLLFLLRLLDRRRRGRRRPVLVELDELHDPLGHLCLLDVRRRHMHERQQERGEPQREQRRRERLAEPDVFLAAPHPQRRRAFGHRTDLAVDDPLEAALDLLVLDVEQVALENREDVAALRDALEDRTPLVLRDPDLLGVLGDAPAHRTTCSAAAGWSNWSPQNVGAAPSCSSVSSEAQTSSSSSIPLALRGERRQLAVYRL